MTLGLLANVPTQPQRLPPRHIGIIMDGNGRWAKQHGLPRLLGHRQGTQNVRRIIGACIERGVRFLTLYAFSTENWARPALEVQGLMRLLGEYIDRETPHLHRMNVQIRHLGRLAELSQSLQQKIGAAVLLTQDNTAITVSVALNYGGRDDIVQAIRALVRAGIAPDQIDEQAVTQHLGTRGIPDPDLIIRTSGESRLSNFLIWQAAYSEFYHTPVLWPDFSPEHLDVALGTFAKRERRFGGVPGKRVFSRKQNKQKVE